jgi:hypothetical protein
MHVGLAGWRPASVTGPHPPPRRPDDARHRETRIHLQLVGNGFIVRTEDGAAVRFTCR